jgi:hypothetical protein
MEHAPYPFETLIQKTHELAAIDGGIDPPGVLLVTDNGLIVFDGKDVLPYPGEKMCAGEKAFIQGVPGVVHVIIDPAAGSA